MIHYTTIGYSDIYPGTKPSINELLDGINSKIVIATMAMINSELNDERDIEEVQRRLTLFMTRQLPPLEVRYIFQKLNEFEGKSRTPVVLWAKRYALEFMKREFINYRDIDRITNSPSEGLRIFKAYLLVADELNEIDRKQLAAVTESMTKEDPFFFEKMVWPFVLKQFSTNERVNPITQMFRLFAFIKYSIEDPEILDIWKNFIQKNDFNSLKNFLGGVNFLITVAQKRHPERELRVFSWIKSTDLPAYLKNQALDRSAFAADHTKHVDMLGFRETPLWETSENEFIVLDLDYLMNKIYNGPLFDLYYKMEMGKHTRFKSFGDFKSHIATEVSEKIVFEGVVTKLFKHKHSLLHFDNLESDGLPDCYLRVRNKIFLIEFKDYLFPGKIVESYSFEDIKSHIDEKFIRNKRGKNKGISQIVAQIQSLLEAPYQFDPFELKQITVYPIIVHTSFTFQMAGVNEYLNTEFRNQLVNLQTKGTKVNVRNLTLFNLDILFELLQLKEISAAILIEFIERYQGIVERRKRRFENESSPDNFVKARASFDEIFATIMIPNVTVNSVKKRTDDFLQAIGADQQLLDSF